MMCAERSQRDLAQAWKKVHICEQSQLDTAEEWHAGFFAAETVQSWAAMIHPFKSQPKLPSLSFFFLHCSHRSHSPSIPFLTYSRNLPLILSTHLINHHHGHQRQQI